MMDSISILLASVLGGILLLCLNHFSYGWRGPSKSGARLPKGSFGFPVIGETIAFVKNPPSFASSHIKRYGRVFKSNLLLQRSIVGTTPEFAKFVLTNNQLFVSGWHLSATQILGTRAFVFKDGPPHMRIKKHVLKVIRPDSLRAQVNVAESIILRNLASWEQQGTVVARDATLKLTLDAGMWMLIGVKDIRSTPEGRKALDNFALIADALVSVPLSLPGSAYRKGLKARADLIIFLKTILQQRRAQQNPRQNDVLGALLSPLDDAEGREELKELDDDEIVDNLLLVLLGATDTTSTSLTWVLKYLIGNPDVFRRVRAEHQEILKDECPSDGGPRLTWEDMKKMVYTSQVFNEVLRIVSIAPFLIRKATQDIEYEGHLIPKGWAVIPMLSSIHSDPEIYLNPHTFNPDRFNVSPKPFTHLPFSAGSHTCPGMEIAKQIAFILIHHIATTYTYESVGADQGVYYTSVPNPVGGFPINISRATKGD